MNIGGLWCRRKATTIQRKIGDLIETNSNYGTINPQSSMLESTYMFVTHVFDVITLYTVMMEPEHTMCSRYLIKKINPTIQGIFSISVHCPLRIRELGDTGRPQPVQWNKINREMFNVTMKFYSSSCWNGSPESRLYLTWNVEHGI